MFGFCSENKSTVSKSHIPRQNAFHAAARQRAGRCWSNSYTVLVPFHTSVHLWKPAHHLWKHILSRCHYVYSSSFWLQHFPRITSCRTTAKSYIEENSFLIRVHREQRRSFPGIRNAFNYSLNVWLCSVCKKQRLVVRRVLPRQTFRGQTQRLWLLPVFKWTQVLESARHEVRNAIRKVATWSKVTKARFTSFWTFPQTLHHLRSQTLPLRSQPLPTHFCNVLLLAFAVQKCPLPATLIHVSTRLLSCTKWTESVSVSSRAPSYSQNVFARMVQAIYSQFEIPNTKSFVPIKLSCFFCIVRPLRKLLYLLRRYW